MGVYDTVTVPCPNCGHEQGFQSKGSSQAACRWFTLENAPVDVMSDVNRHSPALCEGCGTSFAVDETRRKAIAAIYPGWK